MRQYRLLIREALCVTGKEGLINPRYLSDIYNIEAETNDNKSLLLKSENDCVAVGSLGV